MKTFREAINNETLQTKVINIKLNVDMNPHTKNVSHDVTLAFGDHSKDMWNLGDDIGKYTGLKLSEANKYKETPEDAYVYGMVNLMNDGEDIYMFHNRTRLKGEMKKVGVMPALMEQLAHESMHLTRLLLNKVYYNKKGKSMNDVLEENWPTMGEVDDKENPLIIYDEESFCFCHGLIVQQLTNDFIGMIKK